MAVLSGKTTAGESAFDKYIKNNPKWKDLDLLVEEKMEAVFYKENKKDVHSMLSSETKLELVSNQQISIGNLKLAHVKVGNKRGYVPINKIRKPTKTNVLAAEEAAMRDLNNLIQELVTQIGPIKICTSVGNYEGITGVRNITEKVLGREAKADFALVANGKDKIFISHKKSGGPAAYQQYGGVSPKSGSQTRPTLIYDNKEVQDFLMKVTSYIENDKLINPIYSSVNSDTLINQSVFGPSYGGNYGIDNVQCIGQGNPILKPKKNEDACFTLDFSDHVSWNGDISYFKKGQYKAVFAATFRAGRGFDVGGKRYNGARVAIYPIALVQNRSGAKEI